ncbi:MAG: tetratricopeptide repeat protein [Bacteroidota bacterium]
MKKKVTYLYSFERGRAHYNASEYAKALKFFESAYQLEPNNENIERLFVNTLALKLNADNNPEKAYSELERYKIQFPILINDIMFKSLLVNNYLLQFAMAFDDGNEGRGIRYKSLFEEYFEEGLMIPESNLGRAYSLAAVYYFKKGHSSKSRVILNEGLKYDPDNHELLTRKRLIAK